MRGLQDKPVLITGGASGIGRAIALRLGEERARVGILDLNGAGATEVARTITAAGGLAFAHSVNITDYDAVLAAVDAFETQAGPVACLVNNAGWDRTVRFIDSDPALWRKVVDINLYGPVNVTHIVLKRMVAAGRGRVVSIASDAGRVGSSGEAVYAACKGGIIAFTKTLARETAAKGITLNTVCPGPTDTPLLAEIGEHSAGLAEAPHRHRLLQRVNQSR